MTRGILAGAAVLVVTASLLTYPRRSENAGAELLSGARIDPAVRSTLERSCKDCHSDATRYPWYSYIAPVSFLITSDIRQGRERLNLSRWHEYPLIRRQRCLFEIANQVRDREMPLSIYTFLHRDARLSQADIDAIFHWTQTERARLIAEGAAGR